MSTSETSAPVLPYTGKEFLDSLDDGREVWIYGERVKNIAEHPAFRNGSDDRTPLRRAVSRPEGREGHSDLPD
jgi:4-hydroxyphenylacetate 3-monooxygenase